MEDLIEVDEILTASKYFMEEKPYSYKMVDLLSAKITYDGVSIGTLTGVTETSTISIIKMLNGAYKNGIYKLLAHIKHTGINYITDDTIINESNKFLKEKPYSFQMISASATNIFYDNALYLSMNNVNNNSANVIINLLNGANIYGLTRLTAYSLSLNK
jgi:hypothetical protein